VAMPVPTNLRFAVAWGCFEALLDDLRAVLREALGRSADPSAVIIDARTLRSSPESGERAGYDGGKRKKGSKLHIAVDTLGNLLALRVTAASVDERDAVGPLTQEVQVVTDNNVEVAFVDQGYTGLNAAEAAEANGVELIVVKAPEAKKGFVLLPRRWVVERSFAWAVRFRRLVRDYERYASTLGGFHLIAFVCLMLKKLVLLARGS
jgi:transposase